MSPEQRRDVVIAVRVTEEEKAVIERAAEANRLSTSAWCRSALLRLAERVLGDKR